MDDKPACIYCQRDDQRAPLLKMVFKGAHYWICPQHLPVLIHQPAKLVDKLAGAQDWLGDLPAAEHH